MSAAGKPVKRKHNDPSAAEQTAAAAAVQGSVQESSQSPQPPAKRLKGAAAAEPAAAAKSAAARAAARRARAQAAVNFAAAEQADVHAHGGVESASADIVDAADVALQAALAAVAASAADAERAAAAAAAAQSNKSNKSNESNESAAERAAQARSAQAAAERAAAAAQTAAERAAAVAKAAAKRNAVAASRRAEHAIRDLLVANRASFAAWEWVEQVHAKNALYFSPFADEGKGDGSYRKPFTNKEVPPSAISRARRSYLADNAEYSAVAALLRDGKTLFTPPTLCLHYHDKNGSDVTGDGTPANPFKSYQIVSEIMDSYEGACYWYDLKNPMNTGFTPSNADAEAHRRYLKHCKDRWGGKH